MDALTGLVRLVRRTGWILVVVAVGLAASGLAAARVAAQSLAASSSPSVLVQTPGQPPQAVAPSPDTSQSQEPAGQPIFRAGVDLVRVDVSVTGRRDEPVADLTADDFVVTEDDALQKVESAQFIRLDGQRTVDNGESLEIRGPSQGLAEAAKDDVRLYAIFLDDYHIDRLPSIVEPLKDALEDFINQLQPTDLVVLMEPLTTLDSLRFTRDKAQLIVAIRQFQGRRGELFPVKSAVEEAQMTQRNVFELRAAVTLSAMEALATRLGGLREGRKSIIFVSQGPPVGMPGSFNYPRLDAAVEAANRGNVTVHVLDPRPLGMAPFGGAEVLRRFSTETGGRSIVNTNDLGAGLKDVVADASAYYLLGYSPSRLRNDGKFHRISVKVRRSGVRVTSRRGYWAPSEKEMSAPPPPPADPRLAGALATLVEPDEDRTVDIWVGTEYLGPDQVLTRVVWEAAPRGIDTSGSPPASVEVEPVTRTGASLAPAQRLGTNVAETTTAPPIAEFRLQPGAQALRLTVRDARGETIDRWTQSLSIPAPESTVVFLGTPMVFRTRTAAEFRALRLQATPVPTASRRFRRTDRLRVDVPLGPAEITADVVARLTNSQGQVLTTLPVSRGDGGPARIDLPLASLAPSTYTIRIEARVGDTVAAQVVAFTVSQ
jgi:VWFA-related protein